MPSHPDRVRRNYPEGVPQYTVDAKKETSESLGVPTTPRPTLTVNRLPDFVRDAAR